MIPEMWELMERSFSGDDPPFDLVGGRRPAPVEAARAGHVEPLDELIAGDDYSLDDFTPRRSAAVSDRGQLYGLAVLRRLERPDLPRRPLRAARRRGAGDAGRADRRRPSRSRRRSEPTATTTSTASRCAARRTAASTSGSSARPGARRAARAGTTTQAGRRSTRPSCAARSSTTSTCSGGPARPSRRRWTFIDCMACYGAGRAAMTIEPANEASILYDEGGPVADGTKHGTHARRPAGHAPRRALLPAVRDPVPVAVEGRRRGSSPSSSARPSRCSRMRRTERLRRGVAELGDRRRRPSRPLPPELVETTVATRAFARGERPVTRFGMEVGNRIGDEIVRVLTGELTSSEALQEAERTVAALGHPD